MINDRRESAEFIKSYLRGSVPDTAVVLGSGLGDFVRDMSGAVTLPYVDIPHFPRSSAPSHAGQLVSGSVGGRHILVMSGRFHYYEGLSAEEITYYVTVLKLAGVSKLILTNAAGCINGDFHPGELMLITDHLNLSCISPCRGANEPELGQRFFDMSGAYSKRLLAIAQDCADEMNLCLRRGVYAFMAGPQYETPAEIRALKILGADAVGMSTVPEVIEAAHCGLETLCVSCLTNYAAGIMGPLSGDDVVKTAADVMPVFSAYLTSIVTRL
jgi:purine-nucleoside phosphorylase